MPDFRIYHGACSQNDIERATEIAPQISHGHCWTPQKQTPHDNPWFLDNGVYSAWANGRAWDATAWIRTIEECRNKMPRPPTFVVLPDAYGDATLTMLRSVWYRDHVPDDWPCALAVQDGMDIKAAVQKATELDCAYLFVGGSPEWKRKTSPEIVERGHSAGLYVHIARPSLPDGLMWAHNIGADSVDTTTIVRGPAWHHLKRLVSQQTLPEGCQ